MSTLRMMIMGAGAAGATGVAVFTQPRAPEPSELTQEQSTAEVCLKSKLAFFEGVDARCYNVDDLRAMLKKPLVDMSGERVAVMMAHPTDVSVAPKSVQNCADYREMQFEGWYAATSREMRREGFFVRACGVLKALNDAQPAAKSFFVNGSPAEEDVAVFGAGLKFGEAANAPDDVVVTKGDAFDWRISADAMTITIQELANADFDNDGVEEILAFTAGGPQGGGARFYDVGILEKDAEDAPLNFTVLNYGRNKAAGPSG